MLVNYCLLCFSCRTSLFRIFNKTNLRTSGIMFLRTQINIEQSKRNTKNKYLLGRRLRCAKCGYSYVGRTRETKVRKNQYYYCKGREQVPIPLCDMPNFRADILGDIVWSWLYDMLQHPANIADGLLDIREDPEKANSTIFE